MNLLWLLFSFRGRIGRAKYWLWLIGFSSVSGFIFGFFIHFIRPPEEHIHAILISSSLFYTALLYVCASFGAKRLHDRDKSGWWIALFMLGGPALILASLLAKHTVGDLVTLNVISIAGTIGLHLWALIELGFLRGTRGENRFGPDPLAPTSSAPVSAEPGLA
ncbi:DUF805 domain-containing protein [Kaistia sp. UC242_56]|uniref:DUF805 domain-containing protein n=1 Tax=Kaistia sp. UC242_56 TaxID=3374625 RepID=UPI0037AB4A72